MKNADVGASALERANSELQPFAIIHPLPRRVKPFKPGERTSALVSLQPVVADPFTSQPIEPNRQSLPCTRYGEPGLYEVQDDQLARTLLHGSLITYGDQGILSFSLADWADEDSPEYDAIVCRLSGVPHRATPAVSSYAAGSYTDYLV